MDWCKFTVNSLLFFVLNPLLWLPIFYALGAAVVWYVPRMEFFWSITR
jgi:hypothetical protein